MLVLIAQVIEGQVNHEIVVTARVFLTSPFILNNSVETAAPFNVVSHSRSCEPRKVWTRDRWHQAPDA